MKDELKYKQEQEILKRMPEWVHIIRNAVLEELYKRNRKYENDNKEIKYKNY